MLRRVVEKSLTLSSFNIRRFTAQTAAKEKWDLHAGVLVERLPVITKELNELEKKFQALLFQIEFENSLKSDFELRKEKELKIAEKIKKGQMEIDLDDSVTKQTAQDLQDAYAEELKKFQLAPRITEADKKNNLKSSNRQLDETLFLLVEHKLGNDKHMLLPQGIRGEGETMRQTAERVLKQKCGENLNVVFYGNAPCGFYKYKYPAAQRKESVGANIFFFRSTLKGGKIDEKLASKFEWISKKDLREKLKGGYSDSVEQFLI